MRVEMDRQAHLILQRLHQLLRRKGPHQARHVLDAQHVRTHLFQFLGQAHVVLQVILVAFRVQDVAGVAQRAFADGVRLLAHGIHRRLQIGQVVQRVKDAEDIHAVLRRVLDEALHHVVRVVGVAHRVRAAEEHLQQDVRHLRADAAQALPRVFTQEAHRHVKRRAAPHLQGEKVRRAACHAVRHSQHVIGAHACCQQGLVCVAHRRVRQQQLLLLRHPVQAELLRPHLRQQLLGALRRLHAVVILRNRRCGKGLRNRVPLRKRVPVHDRVRQVAQHLRGTVLARHKLQQVRIVVDEARRRLPGHEVRMVHHIHEEGDVCLHPADAEFAQTAVHAVQRLLVRAGKDGHLHQHRVIVGRDHRVRRAQRAVQADAKAARAAVGQDLAKVRRESVLRIFRRDSALDREAALLDLVLHRQRQRLVMHLVPLRDQDLAAHDVDACDLLRHRVLHLDARIHLNEVPLARFVIDQELHRARVRVVHLLRQLHCRVAQAVDDLLLDAIARRLLDHLLVPALHRAVTLMQVQHIAVLVRQDLHFDVLGLAHKFFQKHRPVAKGALRFRLRFIQQLLQVLRLAHHAHAASAAAKGRLDDQRKADLLRRRQCLLAVAHRLIRAFQDRHVQLARHIARRSLVTHHLQDLRVRADEDDPGIRAGLGKLRVLREEAVAWVDGVHALLLRQRHDAFDVQVRAQRSFVLVQLIGLVRLEAVRAEAVLLRIDAHCFQSQLGGRPHHADGDFRAVRHHQFLDGADRGGGWGFLGHGEVG